MVTATGKYYFEGQSFAWVTIDGKEMLSGSHAKGLESLMIDFDNGTADIDIRTDMGNGSEVVIELVKTGMPFNIVTGAYGDKVSIVVNNPTVTESYIVDGDLRGTVGGNPDNSSGAHGMTTSGVFTATTATDATGPKVTVDGVYFGADPHVLNPNVSP